MTVDELDENEDFDNQDPGSGPKALRDRNKVLNQENRDLRERAERADALERELAFAKAGIEPTDKKSQFFIENYKGEFDPETIKSEAIELGVIENPDTGADLENVDLHDQASQQVVGTQAPDTSAPPDVKTQIRGAQSQDEVMAVLAANLEQMPAGQQ